MNKSLEERTTRLLSNRKQKRSALCTFSLSSPHSWWSLLLQAFEVVVVRIFVGAVFKKLLCIPYRLMSTKFWSSSQSAGDWMMLVILPFLVFFQYEFLIIAQMWILLYDIGRQFSNLICFLMFLVFLRLIVTSFEYIRPSLWNERFDPNKQRL